MDEFDLRILEVLSSNSELKLSEIGKKVGIFSPSAVSKRIAKLKENGYIKGFRADIDYEKLGFNFRTITLIKARYNKDYHNLLGKELSDLPGVVSTYFVLGDIDFILLTVSRGKEELLKRLSSFMDNEEIERSDSRIIVQTFKENDYSGIIRSLYDGESSSKS